MGECETNEATSNSAIGIGLVLLACLCYACGNCLQRYSLLRKKGEKVFWVLNRHVGWFVGAIVYFSANGIYSIALSFAPVSVLAAVFSLTIVANATCAWLVLGDQVPKLALPGYASVLAGSVVFSMTVQAEVCHFSGEDLKQVMTSPAAIVYWVIMAFIVFGGIMFAYPFEKMYPIMTDDDDDDIDVPQESKDDAVIDDKDQPNGGDSSNNNQKELAHKAVTGLTDQDSSALQDEENSPSGMQWSTLYHGDMSLKEQNNTTTAHHNNTNSSSKTTENNEDTQQQQQQPLETDYTEMAQLEQDATQPMQPSSLSLLLAGFIYPSSLGATEAVGALILKGVNSLFTTMATDEDTPEDEIDYHIDLWIGFLLVGVFIFAGIVIWLRLTYSRFQITAAFPVEFGMLTFASVVGGFAVFEDHQYVQGAGAWAGVICASLLILGGIAEVGYASWFAQKARQEEEAQAEKAEAAATKQSQDAQPEKAKDIDG
ncbi:expressed unknown protein [Seminavis robusta]|uniref:Magnesium transporter n=1 Tax=Seminavis robusta TaxID=568900 RepID=A0A9N8E4K9_9STRA|nr:expressed unknown protein [Seminavis robusta]|eukprot:Sro543_g163620.1 n/a (485) ;mRNA; f:55379-56833